MLTVMDDPQMAKIKAREADEPKAAVFSFKANLAWREWLHRLADHCRTDAAKVIDRAVIEYAARQKFEEKAPDR